MKSISLKKDKVLKIIIILILFCFGMNYYDASAENIETKETGIYLSPGGDNSHSGTKASPLKSLPKALEMARSVRKDNPETAVTIYVDEGIYQLEQPLVLTAGDSGTENNPLVIKSSGKGEPVFTGSRKIKKWSLLKDPGKLKVLEVERQDKIWVADLSDAGITNYGDPIQPGKRPELFCNGQLQTLARWPNAGFIHAGLARGATELAPTYLKKRGTVEGAFEYLGQRQNRWVNEKEPCLGGYWYYDWSDEFQKVTKIDTVSGSIYLKEPYHNYGYKDSLRYFGVNLFCEIDQPGEWFLDRAEGRIYWYPPKGLNPGKATVSLSELDAPYMLALKDCSHVILQGLAFEESRGSAVSIEGGTGCLVRDCRMERLGRDGIHITGGTGHGVSGCLIRTLGFSGISMVGGDRKNLVPANYFIENTIVEHFSLFKRTYEPAVHLSGCGMRVSNNRFRFSSSSAMRLEGNDFTIEYNEISHVVNESDDQGALDMWYNPSYRGTVIRFNRWSDISGGTHSGAAGVRLDDMISGVIIFGNIFERCGALHFGGVQIHGGKDNLVENNLFYKCHGAVSFSLWGEKRWLDQLDNPVIVNKIYNEVDIRSPLYTSKYPELKTLRDKADFNTVRNNLVVDCQNRFLRNNEKQVFENNPSLSSKGRGIEALCSPKKLGKHGLQPIPLKNIGPRNNPRTRE